MSYSESSEYKASGQESEAFLQGAILREVSFRQVYSMLRSNSFFSAVHESVDEDQWTLVNQLLDQGISEQVAALMAGLDVSVISLIQNPRRCIEIHGGDPEALRRCIEEIDHTGEADA